MSRTMPESQSWWRIPTHGSVPYLPKVSSLVLAFTVLAILGAMLLTVMNAGTVFRDDGLVALVQGKPSSCDCASHAAVSYSSNACPPIPGVEFVPPKETPSSKLAPGSARNESAGFLGSDYPVCILIYIGDDGDKPNDDALPYSSLYRLFNAAKVEVNAAAQELHTSGMKVLVGIDFPSISCKMAKDSFEETHPAVTLVCQTLIDVDQHMHKSNKQRLTCGTVVVGKTNRHVAQLHLDWATALHWENLRAVDMESPDPARAPPKLRPDEWRPTIVTGFSSNHMVVGLLLLRSLGKAGMELAAAGKYNISIVVWTMEEFHGELQQMFDCVVREVNERFGVPIEVRSHNFSAYPPWTRINQSLGFMGGTGEYAWKAIMIHNVILERGFVLWTDAGSRYNRAGLEETLDRVREVGFASRSTGSNLPVWTHWLQIKYFRYHVPYNPPVPNCDASGIGFTLARYTDLMRPWYECSITRQCIAPHGSSRKNHRQDQAALTVVTAMAGQPCTGVSSAVRRHRDEFPNDLFGTASTKCYNDPLNFTALH